MHTILQSGASNYIVFSFDGSKGPVEIEVTDHSEVSACHTGCHQQQDGLNKDNSSHRRCHFLAAKLVFLPHIFISKKHKKHALSSLCPRLSSLGLYACRRALPFQLLFPCRERFSPKVGLFLLLLAAYRLLSGEY